MMQDYSAFIDIIREFIQLFEALIPVEQAKLEAAVDNKVTAVEDCMNREQAAVLKIRGLEKKREDLQKEMGLEGYTFRQILEAAPPEISSTLRPLFDRLSEQVETFRSVSAQAKDMIEVNLHVVQSRLSEDGIKGTYSQSGIKHDEDNTAHFTSRTV